MHFELFYCDHYPFPLPPGHKFPLAKYRMLRDELAADGCFDLEPAELASTDDIVRVHDRQYVESFLDGTIDPMCMRRIGFPWSADLVKRTLASTGGTLCAARAAIARGFGGSLAGGTHHATRSEGSGFCVFNDLAVSIEAIRKEAGLQRFAVVDLDVHQGDGTAAIFAGDDRVFTLSLHAERNFPFRKQKSALDVPLPDEMDDDSYLAALREALPAVAEFRPQMILFQAGVDGLKTDRLGRLSLTQEGLRQRDLLVAKLAQSLKAPLVITIGGGYSDPIEQTVSAHAQTFRTIASCNGLNN